MLSLEFVLLCVVLVRFSSAMLDTSISCTDTDCPIGLECVIPMCMVDPCFPIQPICLPLNALETWILEQEHHVIDHHQVTHHLKTVKIDGKPVGTSKVALHDHHHLNLRSDGPASRRYMLFRPKSRSAPTST